MSQLCECCHVAKATTSQVWLGTRVCESCQNRHWELMSASNKVHGRDRCMFCAEAFSTHKPNMDCIRYAERRLKANKRKMNEEEYLSHKRDIETMLLRDPGRCRYCHKEQRKHGSYEYCIVAFREEQHYHTEMIQAAEQSTNHAIERIRMGDESRARLTALQMGITAQSEAAQSWEWTREDKERGTVILERFSQGRRETQEISLQQYQRMQREDSKTVMPEYDTSFSIFDLLLPVIGCGFAAWEWQAFIQYPKSLLLVGFVYFLGMFIFWGELGLSKDWKWKPRTRSAAEQPVEAQPFEPPVV